MTQAEKARSFTELHIPGKPIVLYNIWDAGSAKAVADAGANAIATGSWSVAAAQGYPDGQAIPLDFLCRIVSRITQTIDLPLTVDFESGYAESPDELGSNMTQLLNAGAIGINFEDQIVGGQGLYATEIQAQRIRAIRQSANDAGIPLFINARTDLFLKEKDTTRHAALLSETIERGHAYLESGASGLFVPGLVDHELIRSVCDSVNMPVNVMQSGKNLDVDALGNLGVARISFGPWPHVKAMKKLAAEFKEIQNSDSTMT